MLLNKDEQGKGKLPAGRRLKNSRAAVRWPVWGANLRKNRESSKHGMKLSQVLCRDE